MTFKQYIEYTFGLDADERVPTYIKEHFDGVDDMQLYPKYERILNYLIQNVGECEVVRMNKPSDDVTVWYFVNAWDSFYIIYLSDCN